MKNLNLYLIVLTLTSTALYTKSQLPDDKDVFLDQITVLNQQHPKHTQFINFSADNQFGGQIIQGRYDHKHKTAVINNNNQEYNFIHLIEDRNPTLDKVSQRKLVKIEDPMPIGSYVDHLMRGMPVTIYLYGQLVQE